MDRTIGLVAFLFLCPNSLGLQLIRSYPKAFDDQYELLHNSKTYRLRQDAQGGNFTSATDIHSLNVLQNDEVAALLHETCIIAPKVGQNAGAKQMYDGFEEVAEKVGLTHSYRAQNPTRPYCLFDFKIPIRNSSKDVRLKGEFCTPECLPGAAAVADYDQDGYPDIFFTVHDGNSVLYRNKGTGSFEDVTTETNLGPEKYASAAAWADFDADGDLDLYVTTIGGTRHHLYINQGGRFTEEAVERNASAMRPDGRKISGMTPNVGDYDLDGYPDIYITEWALLKPYQNSSSRLLHNLGAKKPGYFEDVTVKAGVDMDRWRRGNSESPGTFTFCSSFTDMDEDGLPELIVTTDYGDSRIFWNDGNGSFTECTAGCGIQTRVDAMGHAIGDWNGDGHLEWFSSGIHESCELMGCLYGNGGNALFKNLNQGRHIRWFEDVAEDTGVDKGHWGWGTTMFDFNNDKFLDFILTNGFDSPSTTQDDPFATDPMLLWVNQGLKANLTTLDEANQLGINNTKDGRGLLKFDFDSDGDEDVVVIHNVGKPALYENLAGNRNFWLRVKVVHRCAGQDFRLCDSFHARVTVTTPDGWMQTQEIGSGAHFMAQNEIVAHFGLGSALSADVFVYWPSFKIWMNYTAVQANQRILVVAPTLKDARINSTVAYRQLKQCARLSITSVSNNTKGAQVSINYGGASLSVIVGDPETEQTITFDYTIGVEPASLSSGIVSTGTVTVFVREEPVRDVSPNCLIRRFPQTDQRRLDGVSNNRNYTWWGAVAEILARDLPEAYSDGLAGPSSQCTAKMRSSNKCPYPDEYAGEGSSRQSPRVISNKLFHQAEPVYSKRHLSDMSGQFGQFLVHDTDFSSPLPRFEFQTVRGDVWLPIPIPTGDVHFDPFQQGDNHLPFIRSTYERKCTGRLNRTPRQQVNKLTSIIDGSMIYGNSENVNGKLRTSINGKLILQDGGIIPYNTMGLANDNPVGRPRDQLLAAGDSRSNVQPGLIALHSLFVREHNRQCDEYLKKSPNASDRDAFEGARRVVIAELQAITFREFLPALFGRDLPPYNGYNQSVKADAGNAFATAAFRYGHSQVNSDLWRFDKNWKVIPDGHLPLRDSYFKPERVIREGGIDPLLRGFVYQPAQEVDTLMVDDMRNVLFPIAKRDGLDLAAMNIQRGRDHGLPNFNFARGYLNLKKYNKFSDISDDAEVVKTLEELYQSVNDVDLWVGGLAEKKVNGSELGSLFEALMLKNFLRFRDGDYYWYERNMTANEQAEIHALTLSKIIQLNTDFKDVPENVFFSSKDCQAVKNHQCVPRPQKECTTQSPTTAVTYSNSNTTYSVGPTTVPTTSQTTTDTHTATTLLPSTKAATTSVPTTLVPTTSGPSCCSELDNCTSDKSGLNDSLSEMRRNCSGILREKMDLARQLAAEKLMVGRLYLNLTSLQGSCANVRAEEEKLNQTVQNQTNYILSLRSKLHQLEVNSSRLQQSFNTTTNLLRETQQNEAENAKSCQNNITSIQKENQKVENQLMDFKALAASLNASLLNATGALSECRQTLTFQASTSPPTSQPASTAPAPTTASPMTTIPPTTQLPTYQTSNPSPCPTVDSALLSEMTANLSQLQQNYSVKAKEAASLQNQLQTMQSANSKLQTYNAQLQNSTSLRRAQLKQCELDKGNAYWQLKSCQHAVKVTSTPTMTKAPPTKQPTRPKSCQEDIAELRKNATKTETVLQQTLRGNEELQTKYASATAELDQCRGRNCTFQDMIIDFPALLGSSLGLIVLSVAGGLLLLCIIFFVLFVVFCVKYRRSKSDDTPKKYDFTVKNRAYQLGVTEKDYSASEDAFD